MRSERDVCGYCSFYHQWPSHLWTRTMHGECRKSAPTPADGFATIRVDDWCGDFKSKYHTTPEERGHE